MVLVKGRFLNNMYAAVNIINILLEVLINNIKRLKIGEPANWKRKEFTNVDKLSTFFEKWGKEDNE